MKSAEKRWSEIDNVLHNSILPAIATSHYTKFGQCEYYEACLHLNLDKELMKNNYIQVEKHK